MQEDIDMDMIESEVKVIFSLTDILIIVDSRDLDKNTIPIVALKIKEAAEKIWNYLQEKYNESD